MGPIRLFLPLVFLVTTSVTVLAQEKPLTLRKAIQQAVAGNVDLKRERLTIQSADAQLLIARAPFDFTLSSDLVFSRRTTPALTNQDLQGGSTDSLSLGLGLARRLETGGQITFSADTTASETDARFACGTIGGAQTKCTVYATDVDLRFTHPLLRGFGSEIALANLRRARVQKDQALLNRQMRAANVVRDVINTYWGLAYATQNLAIRRSAVELAQEQLRVTRAQIDVGRLAPVDAAAVERAIGERQQEVLLSEQEMLFRTLELRRLFGLPIDAGVAVYAASDMPEANVRDVNVSAEMQEALASNPQLRALTLGIALSEIDMQTARSTLRPQLDFVSAIGATGRNRNLNDAVAQAFGLDELTMSAGLSFQLPIENRAARGQRRAAELDAQLSRIDAGDMRMELQNQVVRLSSMVSTASKRVELAKATVGFANQNLEAEKARFSVGRSTNNDVLLRQQELKNAEIQVVQATVDLLVADTSLAALSNEVLDRYNIVLVEAD